MDVKIFTGTKSEYLSERIADFYGFKLGDKTILKFSDGEMQPIINESVRGSYVFLIQSTFAPAENLMELLLMIDTVKSCLLYTSPSPRDQRGSRMPSSA